MDLVVHICGAGTIHGVSPKQCSPYLCVEVNHHLYCTEILNKTISPTWKENTFYIPFSKSLKHRCLTVKLINYTKDKDIRLCQGVLDFFSMVPHDILNVDSAEDVLGLGYRNIFYDDWITLTNESDVTFDIHVVLSLRNRVNKTDEENGPLSLTQIVHDAKVCSIETSINEERHPTPLNPPRPNIANDVIKHQRLSTTWGKNRKISTGEDQLLLAQRPRNFYIGHTHVANALSPMDPSSIHFMSPKYASSLSPYASDIKPCDEPSAYPFIESLQNPIPLNSPESSNPVEVTKSSSVSWRVTPPPSSVLPSITDDIFITEKRYHDKLNEEDSPARNVLPSTSLEGIVKVLNTDPGTPSISRSIRGRINKDAMEFSMSGFARDMETLKEDISHSKVSATPITDTDVRVFPAKVSFTSNNIGTGSENITETDSEDGIETGNEDDTDAGSEDDTDASSEDDTETQSKDANRTGNENDTGKRRNDCLHGEHDRASIRYSSNEIHSLRTDISQRFQGVGVSSSCNALTNDAHPTVYGDSVIDRLTSIFPDLSYERARQVVDNYRNRSVVKFGAEDLSMDHELDDLLVLKFQHYVSCEVNEMPYST